MKRKILAVIITIGIMAAVKPGRVIAPWESAVATMLFYVISTLIIDAVCGEIKARRRRQRRRLETRNIRRWAEQDFGGRYIEIIS